MLVLREKAGPSNNNNDSYAIHHKTGHCNDAERKLLSSLVTCCIFTAGRRRDPSRPSGSQPPSPILQWKGSTHTCVIKPRPTHNTNVRQRLPNTQIAHSRSQSQPVLERTRRPPLICESLTPHQPEPIHIMIFTRLLSITRSSSKACIPSTSFQVLQPMGYSMWIVWVGYT
jgi:hypothetical protein